MHARLHGRFAHNTKRGPSKTRWGENASVGGDVRRLEHPDALLMVPKTVGWYSLVGGRIYTNREIDIQMHHQGLARLKE
jgi:hypothetical protein